MSALNMVTMVALGIASCVVAPITLIWGWVRWVQRAKPRTIPSILSLFGFILATASAILSLYAIADAHVHPYGFYDPRLMKIMGWGMMLSLAGFLIALGGIWRTNSLRWYAPLCAIGTFAFWILAAAGE